MRQFSQPISQPITMQPFLLPLLLLLLCALCSACTPPSIVWDSIDVLFGVQVLSTTHAAVHQQYISLSPSGGGDQHAFLGASAASRFQLQGGAWTHPGSATRAVVSTQRDADGTRMLFFTQRTQQLAELRARFACADDGAWRVLFGLADGAATCVRPAGGGRYELRYRPVGVEGMCGCPVGGEGRREEC